MSEETRARALRAVPIVLGVIAGVTYSDYLIDLVLRPDGIDQLEIVSHLEARGAPYSELLRASDIVSGVLTVVVAVYVYLALPRGWFRWAPSLMLAAFGVMGALTAVFPDPCQDPYSGCGGAAGATSRDLHNVLSTYSDIALLLGPLALGLASLRRGRRWVTVSGFAMLGFLIVINAIYREHEALGLPGASGFYQRLAISAASLWVILAGVVGADGVRRGREPVTEVEPATSS